MRKRKPLTARRPDDDSNMLWAVSGLLLVATMAAGFTAYACEYVLESFQSPQTMTLFITDAGIRSDDLKLERHLTTATLHLNYLRDIGLAVLVGSAGVVIAVAIRLWRSKS